MRHAVVFRRHGLAIWSVVWAGAAICTGTVAPPVAWAQVEPAAASTPTELRPQIDAIYQQATAAQSLQQLNPLLEQCQQLLSQDLAEAEGAYLERLTAWIYNRRGEAYAKLASRQASQQDQEGAQRSEQQALADFDKSIELNATFRAYHNRGVSYAMMGQYEQALADFAAAIQRNPKYLNARYNRAEILYELGRYEEAEQEYGQVLRLDGQDVAAHSGRGHARFQLGKLEAALTDFDAVIELDPDSAEAYADRADLHAFAGRWQQAAADYKVATNLNNQLGRVYQSVAWLMATCPDEQFRNATLALRAAEKAIQLDGQADYRYLDTLAAAQANAQQFAAAERTIRQAIEIAPAEVLGELRQRLTLYGEQQAFRDVR